MPWESADDGFIAKILVGDGTELPVGQLVAIMVDSADDVAAFKDFV